MPTTEQAQTTLIDRFRERAGALGVIVEHVSTPNEAAAFIASVARDLGTSESLLSQATVDASAALSTALGTQGLTVRTPASVDDAIDAALAVSLATQAIAETGSTLLDEGDLLSRAVSMLSLTHIIICPTDALVSDLNVTAAALREIASRPYGSFATISTGPSRTADIERTLTIGVQGPAKVYVLFVDALE